MVKACVGLLVVILASGCAPAPVGANPPKTLTALGHFEPGHATPERRAKLEAVRSKLDELYERHAREARPTGMAVGIVMDGELVYAKTLGVRDVTSNAPVDQDTVFRIASMTKNVAAMALVQLRDEGRLSLDAPVSDFVPEFRNFIGSTRDAAPITVRMLVTHASGLAYDESRLCDLGASRRARDGDAVPRPGRCAARACGRCTKGNAGCDRKTATHPS